MVNVEPTDAHLQEIELDNEIVQLEQYVKRSRKQAYYYLTVSLKNFHLSFSYLRTSLTALLSWFVFTPKLAFLRVKGWSVSR